MDADFVLGIIVGFGCGVFVTLILFYFIYVNLADVIMSRLLELKNAVQYLGFRIHERMDDDKKDTQK